MSEYQEKHSVAKPQVLPTHVGHEDTSGLLIEKLQEHSIVLLLDEVEKVCRCASNFVTSYG